LKEALRQLRETDLKIEAVAIDVGYRSKKDFYRMVRVRLGCTPGQLRRQPPRRPRQRAAQRAVLASRL
jgi:AraC-like DNA-binding protein